MTNCTEGLITWTRASISELYPENWLYFLITVNGIFCADIINEINNYSYCDKKHPLINGLKQVSISYNSNTLIVTMHCNSRVKMTEYIRTRVQSMSPGLPLIHKNKLLQIVWPRISPEYILEYTISLLESYLRENMNLSYVITSWFTDLGLPLSAIQFSGMNE